MYTGLYNFIIIIILKKPKKTKQRCENGIWFDLNADPYRKVTSSRVNNPKITIACWFFSSRYHVYMNIGVISLTGLHVRTCLSSRAISLHVRGLGKYLHIVSRVNCVSFFCKGNYSSVFRCESTTKDWIYFGPYDLVLDIMLTFICIF